MGGPACRLHPRRRGDGVTNVECQMTVRDSATGRFHSSSGGRHRAEGVVTGSCTVISCRFRQESSVVVTTRAGRSGPSENGSSSGISPRRHRGHGEERIAVRTRPCRCLRRHWHSVNSSIDYEVTQLLISPCRRSPAAAGVSRVHLHEMIAVRSGGSQRRRSKGVKVPRCEGCAGLKVWRGAEGVFGGSLAVAWRAKRADRIGAEGGFRGENLILCKMYNVRCAISA